MIIFANQIPVRVSQGSVCNTTPVSTYQKLLLAIIRNELKPRSLVKVRYLSQIVFALDVNEKTRIAVDVTIRILARGEIFLFSNYLKTL